METKLPDSVPTFVSLFAGAGGLDLGLEAAGWRCAYASDNYGPAVETLQANAGRHTGNRRSAFASAMIEQADVTGLTPGDVLSRAGLCRGGAQLLAGGPPCQSWSSAGHQRGFDDPRGRLFDDFVRIANGLDVRWLIVENVRGLLTARGADGQPGSALASIRKRLLDVGFQTAVSLLNAADYGVAQRRVRLFIIGFRSGDVPHFPVPTHARLSNDRQVKGWVTLGQALASISPLTGDEVIRPNARLEAELADIGPGSGIKSPGKSERTRPGGHWGYKQGCFVADIMQSARTVTASPQQDWIRDPVHGMRRLTPRECAALQGFSPDWRFIGSAATRYKLIGNAVPPPLGQAIGAALLRQIDPNPASPPDLRELLPLPPKLQSHIRYTEREEASNGASRRCGLARRNIPPAATGA